MSALQAALYEDSGTPGEVLWGPSDPQEGSLLLSKPLKKRQNKRTTETYYSERDITEDRGDIQDILPTGVFI